MPDAPRFECVLERCSRPYLDRYDLKVGPERFKGLETLEDLPFYAWTKRLLRQASKFKGPEPGQPRPLERPDWVPNRMEDRCPQFFLRNITRVERHRDEDEGLPFKVVATRDREAENVLLEIRKMRYEPPRLLEHWNLDDVLWFRALIKRYVHQEDWRTRFGRELKEHVQGPLYKYEPGKE